MLKWLARVLQIEPAPKKIMKLETKLTCETDPSMYGDAEFEFYEGGGWEIEVEVDHPKGAPAEPFEAFLAGTHLLTLRQERNESEGKLSSRRGDTLPMPPTAGMIVEVKGPGGLLLTGTLQRDPRYAPSS